MTDGHQKEGRAEADNYQFSHSATLGSVNICSKKQKGTYLDGQERCEASILASSNRRASRP
jgi:hypothetical protein